MKSIQEQIPHNHCYGCGQENPSGLQLKSYHQEDGSTVADFTPQAFHNAGPAHFLNGGIQATLIDCHSICTALADAYRRAGRTIGEGELLWYATGKIEVNYLKPVAIDQPVKLVATVELHKGKKTVVNCQLFSQEELCAAGVVTAVRVPNSWLQL